MTPEYLMIAIPTAASIIGFSAGAIAETVSDFVLNKGSFLDNYAEYFLKTRWLKDLSVGSFAAPLISLLATILNNHNPLEISPVINVAMMVPSALLATTALGAGAMRLYISICESIAKHI